MSLLIGVFNTIRLALKSLVLHKLRSGLTMLGIVFGVFSVIAMLAIGEGASEQAQKQVLELGATNIIVRSMKPPEEGSQGAGGSFVLKYGLLRSDYDLLTKTIPTIANAVPIREEVKETRYLHRTINARVVGCTTDYLDINHLFMADGRFISDQDQADMDNVVVIAQEVAEALFKLENPLGKAIQINKDYYSIVGITRARTASAGIGGSLSAQDYNKDVYIPIRTFQVRIGDRVIRRAQGSFSATEVQLNQITLQVKDQEAVIPTADVVKETLDRTHTEKKDIAVVVPLELLKQAEQIRMIFNIVLGAIASISLVVGGIGIMNIMLATVTERTREIGIRRALGATQRDITIQFLSETIVLAGTGGVVGVILGLLTPFAFDGIQWSIEEWVLTGSAMNDAARMFLDMEPRVAFYSLPLAFGISVFIGIISGLYPAWSAAKLDPIEALRHE